MITTVVEKCPLCGERHPMNLLCSNDLKEDGCFIGGFTVDNSARPRESLNASMRYRCDIGACGAESDSPDNCPNGHGTMNPIG